MKIPMLNLKAQYAEIKEEIDAAIRDVVESQAFIMGPSVAECEQAIAEYCGTDHAVGVSSGTDALLICLMAEGIGPGDEVITSDYTFFASGGSIARTGARPVFVDIDPATFNLDPARIEQAITPATRAIIPVHLFGQACAMDPILDIARRHNLTVIEDAAQSIGARYRGRSAGSMGDYGCFSFFPAKNLGGYGDGGMVVTGDAERAAHLRSLRAHGAGRTYHHDEIGGNFRLDSLQAAVVKAKLPHLERWTERRRANADAYDRLFAEAVPGAAHSDDAARREARIVLPARVEPSHVFNQYVLLLPGRRDRGFQALRDAGIACAIYYPVPLHAQKCFSALNSRPKDSPNSDFAAANSLAIPIDPALTDAQQEHIVATLAKVLSS